MPFINDRLTNNREAHQKSIYKSSMPRTSRFKFDPQEVMAALRRRIIGQEKTLDLYEDILTTIKADFAENSRPLCVVLLMGPTGSGKTESVRILSEAMLGSTKKLCRIDMNTLGQEHYSAAITGSPPGYVGSKEGTSLLNKELIEGSFSEPGIVLFDEIEKSDKSVSRAMMNIFDSGKLILTAATKEINFSNTLIFMTCNISVKPSIFYQKQKKFMGYFLKRNAFISQENNIKNVLSNHFDREFINRIDHTCVFSSIDKSQLNQIIDIEIEKLNLRLAKKSAKIVVDNKVKDLLMIDYNSIYGVRDLKRIIKNQIESKLAKALLEESEVNEFYASVEDAKIVVKVKDGIAVFG